jgi:hypothetical protein
MCRRANSSFVWFYQIYLAAYREVIFILLAEDFRCNND